MSRLPVLSGRDIVKALSQIGYYIRDQRGSHIHLRHPTRPPLTIPAHREVARGTLRAIIKAADLTVEAFLELL